MAYDLGDVVPLSVEIRDTAGALADAGAVTLTIALPDGTTTTPAVTSPSTGVYEASHPAAMVGLHAVRWAATGTNAGAYDDVFEVRPSGSRWIVSLADAKAELNITGTGDDEELRGVLDEAHDLVERYPPGVTLAPRSRTEQHPGGSTTLRLRWPPVREVTTVTVAGTALAEADYDLLLDGDAAVLIPASGTFGGDGDQVVVEYAAGWASPPPAAVRAVKAMLAHLWATQRGSMGGRNAFAGGQAPTVPGAAYLFPNRVLEALSLLSSQPGIG